LIERPVEGFTKGPLEGGMGLVQGAGSLVQHTVAGAFNSLNKITGSVGSGLSSLTMDEEYIKERDKMRL
jgi:vacuolar protein sorting-associated protein 13A/C